MIDFSVSMCVYGKDNPVWFKDAVNSVINQTVKPKEIVLVVDGPVPSELNEIINTYENNNLFHVIRLKENQGHGNARRIGLENCKYEYVALMDADDISVNDRFEKELEMFKNDNSLTIVGSNITEFIESISNTVGIREVPTNDFEIKRYMKKRCPMNQVTVIFKKTAIEEVGGYIDWYCEEDYYLWLRLAMNNYKFANVPESLVFVRVGKEMYNRRGGIKYFKSEKKLQKFMLKNKIINRFTYCSNVIKRFILQVCLPNKLRGYIFKKFARK